MSDSFKPSERTQFQPRRNMQRDWKRYARALDMRLDGIMLADIGRELGVTKERARQMVEEARRQLAYRVFKGVPRPLPTPTWQRWALLKKP